MKRLTAIFLILTLFTSTLVVSADGARVFEEEQTYAQKLNALGLFCGTEKGFELERTLTRTEAIVLMIRTLGKEAQAKEYGKTHPFTDVASWADGYISYAYDMGLTNGISDTIFGNDDTVESNMYLTFILRAMGYTDEGDVDFIWQMPYAMAAEIEMLPPTTDIINFVRGDAVTFLAAALFAKCKGADVCLYERLIEEGVFTKEKWDTVFPDDPFVTYRVQNRAVGDAVRSENGEARLNDHYFYNHMLLDITDKGEYVEAVVPVHHAHYTIWENNQIGSSGSGSGIRRYILDKETWQVVDEIEGGAFKWSEFFPESAIGPTNNFVWKGMNIRLGFELAEVFASGALAYTAPTYEQMIEKYMVDEQNLYSISERIETDECTVLSGYLSGVPHGPAGFVCLIYKPGSVKGSGAVVSLPLPETSAWGARKIPEELSFSEDGKTLSYSFCFDSDMVLEIDEEVKRVVHEAGTYNYTVDIVTGETVLEIVK